MRSASASRQGLSPLKLVSFVVVALVVGAITTVGTLWAFGVKLPFLSRKGASVAEAAGTRVPVSARAIPAYTKITRDDFYDPEAGKVSYRVVSPEDATRDGLLPLDQILGRVLKKDKAAYYAFKETDFFPEKTRPGMVAGIPQGKRAFVLPAEKVSGVAGLKMGDRFDLVGTLPVDFDKVLARYHGNGMPDPSLALQETNNLPKRASVKVLVQNGAVVLPVTTREIPTGAGSAGGPVPTKPVQEITIAVDPHEVASLTEAVAIHAEMICVARSGLPNDPGEASVTPGLMPSPPVRTVETIFGNKRQVLLFPKPGEGPEVSPALPAEEKIAPSPEAVGPAPHEPAPTIVVPPLVTSTTGTYPPQ